MAGVALIACGFQHDFCDPAGALARSGRSLDAISAMLGEAERLLAAARARGVTVLHAPEQALLDGMSDSPAWRAQAELNGWSHPITSEGQWGEGMLDAFAPLPNELVVPRHRPGALRDSRAGVLLRSAQVDRVVVMGVEIHRAVLATALQAVGLDFHVLVPRDAVAGTDPAAAEAALEVLRSWARVLTIDELLTELPEPAVATTED